jgi:hypothetical protein
MKYAVEMASGGMIYIPSFMKTDTGVYTRILSRGMCARTHTQGKTIS